MAIFKIGRGNEADLPTSKVDGKMYLCRDTGNVYFDCADASGDVVRYAVNAKYASALKKAIDGHTMVVEPEDIMTLAEQSIFAGIGEGSAQMQNVPAVTAPNDAGETPPPSPTTEQPQANGNGAFAIGIGTIADGDVSVAEGINTKAGYERDDGSRNVGSHAEGIGTYAKSSGSHAEGFETKALASNAHTEGFQNTVNGAAWSGHAEGRENIVNSRAGHAEGYKNKIEENAEDSHVEGQNNTLSGVAGHAEGQNNKVSGKAAHVEGSNCEATGNYSHAEGRMSKASGWGSHAEGAATTDGTMTEATAKGSHAEGVGTKATGADAHAEGALTEASGAHSHAEGYKTKAAADYSHAGGACNETNKKFSTVIGKYAKVIESNSDILFAIGNGTGATASKRKNAFEVHEDGTALLGDKQISAADVYYIKWTSLEVESDSALSAVNLTVNDKGGTSISGLSFYAILSTALLSANNNIKIVFLGPSASSQDNIPDGNIQIKCTTSSISKMSNSYRGAIQISGYVGCYEGDFARAKANQSIKFNVFPDGQTSCYIMKFEANSYFPCLIEGTEITMADNMVKPIEQIKAGDIVLSYNPVTKEKTSAVVIGAYKTGTSNKFDVFSFENGKHLTTYGIHGFYANDLGYVKNIQNINRNNELIDSNLDYTYLIVKREMYFHGVPKGRYNLITSNNLYFANGILLGHSPWQKMQYYINRNITPAENIKSTYQGELDKYNAYQSFMNNPAYHAEVAASYAQLAGAIEEIKNAKAKLAATDYKVQKYTEGVLSEEEWLEAKEKRAEWRQVVNSNETLRNESKKAVDNIIAKYRNGVTMKSLFNECCMQDNALFETVKAHFTQDGGEAE